MDKPLEEEGTRWNCGCLVIGNKVVESCDPLLHPEGSRWTKFAKGERVYLYVGDGVNAPQGRVWHDDGGDWVTVVAMRSVFGVTRDRPMVGMIEAPADRLRACRRGKNFLPLMETPSADSHG